MSQAAGSSAGGLAALRTESSRHVARVLATAPACAPSATGVHDFAPGAGRTVALTFDDGPGPSTAAILAILADEHVPATFFNLGTSERLRPREVVREAAAGYALGNHTWDHAVLPQLTSRAQAEEIDRESAEQVTITGGRPCLFRPPYGAYDDATLTAAERARMTLWNWSVDTEDWKAQGSASPYWVHRITNRAEDGATQPHPVILMHDQVSGNPATVAALRPVIRHYRQRGFTFVDLYGRTWQPPGVGAARAGTGLVVVRVGGDGTLRAAVHFRQGWTRWADAGGRAAAGVAAVAASSRSLLMAATGSDHHVRVRWVRHGVAGRWRAIGGSVVGRPALTRLPDGGLALVVQRVDDAVWLREWRRGGWHRWRSLGGHVIAAPAVGSSARGGGLVVVAVDSNGALIERREHSGTWSRWGSLGGAAAGDPSMAVSMSGSRAVLAVPAADGGVQLRALRRSGQWGGWRSVPGHLSSAPTVLVDDAGVRVFGVRRSDGAVVQAVGTARLRGWSGWRHVGR